MKRTLYLLPTCYALVWFNCKVQPPRKYMGKQLFIQCNKKGEVNWNKASIYTANMLFNKKVEIIQPNI